MRSASFSASSRSCVVSRMVVSCSGQYVYQLVELAARVRIEPRGRLVQEQQLGAADDPDRDVESSALASRQGHDLLVGVLGQSHPVEKFLDIARAGLLGRRVGHVVTPQVV